jgi:hypothetical protein
MDSQILDIWIFHGAGGRFSSGAFTTKKKAEDWINKHNLTGILTKYPLNEGIYDWALNNGFFEVRKEDHKKSEFIQRFTTASQEHYHYEEGKLD